MIYILTTLLFILGVSFHVMGKITSLRKKFPELSFNSVFTTFFQAEWDSLIVSALVLASFQIYLYVMAINSFTMAKWYSDWGIYAIALVLGYAGQRLAYKYLKTAEEILERKVENLKN